MIYLAVLLTGIILSIPVIYTMRAFYRSAPIARRTPSRVHVWRDGEYL